jgi:hypothetical protein
MEKINDEWKISKSLPEKSLLNEKVQKSYETMHHKYYVMELF